MGWSIFIEEPGIHQRSLPYGALVGVAVEDRFIWQLARKLRDAQIQYFGARLSNLAPYVTVDSILTPELVQVASGSVNLPSAERALLTLQYLDQANTRHSVDQVVAFAQSQLSFCKFALGLLNDFGSKILAVLSPVEDVNLIYADYLRKDYAFLFERVSYFLEMQIPAVTGTLIIDPSRHSELFVSFSSIVSYFEKTTKGRMRSQYLIPEPLMSNSSLQAINQSAVIVSRVLSGGLRLPNMTKLRRVDLDELVRQCNNMRFSFEGASGKKDWSFKFIEHVRARHEISQPSYVT